MFKFQTKITDDTKKTKNKMEINFLLQFSLSLVVIVNNVHELNLQRNITISHLTAP
jgi:hypothetical protein